MIIWKEILFITIGLLHFTSIEALLDITDDEYFGKIADEYDWNKHPCKRSCNSDTTPGVCKYVLVIEQYYTMSKACFNCPYNVTDCFRPNCIPADGNNRVVYSVNREIYAPLIEVCQNDVIEVEVRNRMLSESTTIHWHGIKQEGTQYMDGVAYLTQCPILPGNTFTYTFRGSEPGTYFWHSHIGSQRADGLSGSLIIKPYDKDNHFLKLYDYDIHPIVINDWTHDLEMSETIHEHFLIADLSPYNVLINSLGPNKMFKTEDGKVIHTPYDVNEVEQHKRYRIRFISAGAGDCPIQVSIDNHKLLVISMDANDIEPTEVDALNMWSGERVDIVLNADQKIGNYWIRVSAFSVCQENATHGVYQGAILRYKGAKIENPPGELKFSVAEAPLEYKVLNPYGIGTELKSKNNIQISDLKSIAPSDRSLQKKADHQIFIEFDYYEVSDFDYQRAGLFGYHQVKPENAFGIFLLNNISLKLPAFPPLSQPEMLTKNAFCDRNNYPSHCKLDERSHDACECTHAINLKLNSVVEIVLIDQGNVHAFSNHPIHLHGHFYRVVGMEVLGGEGYLTIDQFKQLDKEGKIQRNLNQVPLKDTVKVPKHGYTIIRFVANNPGYWLLHCHFEAHSNMGMALVFKIGEHSDLPPVPKKFPRCGENEPEMT